MYNIPISYNVLDSIYIGIYLVQYYVIFLSQCIHWNSNWNRIFLDKSNSCIRGMAWYNVNLEREFLSHCYRGYLKLVNHIEFEEEIKSLWHNCIKLLNLRIVPIKGFHCVTFTGKKPNNFLCDIWGNFTLLLEWRSTKSPFHSWQSLDHRKASNRKGIQIELQWNKFEDRSTFRICKWLIR